MDVIKHSLFACRSFPQNISKSLRLKLLVFSSRLVSFLLLLLTATALNAQVQLTFGSANGPTLLTGGSPDLTVGAKYIYQNVATSSDGIAVDAIVTIVAIKNSKIENNIIDNILSVDDRFEPVISTSAKGGFVEWQVEFVYDGTVTYATDLGIRAFLDSFVLEAIDVDGGEFFDAIVTNSYTLEGDKKPETELKVSTNGMFTRFQSGDDSANIISAANTQYIVRINYQNVNVINFRNGSSNDHDDDKDSGHDKGHVRVKGYGHDKDRDDDDDNDKRQSSIGFLGEVTFDTEKTTVLNVAPTVVDSTGNETNVDTVFNTNVLTGADDADGNLDLSTVVLIDAGNPANQGSVAKPLVLPGVGTYTVDAAGNTGFTPVTGYKGSADIYFTVSDALGVSSNRGSLGLAVVDPVPLTVDIQGEPAAVNSTAAFNVTVEFSADVTGFIVSEISVGNGSAGNFVAVDGNTYTADITPNGSGDITIDVAANVAQDSVGNLNAAAIQAVVSFIMNTDSDGDGIPDAIECPAGPPFNAANCPDTDGDGSPDFQDTDSDNDGTPDSTEGATDTDGDGTPDFQDTDSDNDGIPDSTEGTGDTDGDGIPDYVDLPTGNDFDGDGIPDNVECPAYPNCPDTDGDGIPDYSDSDSDGDGITDAVEAGTDPTSPIDTDGDGLPDYQDTDSDNDGTDDSVEGTGDMDGDGIPDYVDAASTGPGAGDSDGDGIPDNIECELYPLCADSDADGTPDYMETDSDNDGIPDAVEANTSGVDSDGDGIDDNSDIDNFTPGVDALDQNGDGIVDTYPLDSDGDGTPDYQDTDSDNDGTR